MCGTVAVSKTIHSSAEVPKTVLEDFSMKGQYVLLPYFPINDRILHMAPQCTASGLVFLGEEPLGFDRQLR